MTVHYEAHDAVRVLALDRPARRNAIDRATAEALLEGYRRFEADAEARVLVVTGRGGVFSAGADLAAFDNDVLAPGGPLGFTRLVSSKPLIAAVEGWCVAGGLELALACDLRVAGAGARFGCLERRFGVPLIDGGTQRLPRVVGLSRALDLILTGRVVDSAEALAMGLVDRRVADGSALEAALELASTIAAFPWACLLADRAHVFAGLGRPLPEGLGLEAEGGLAVLEEARRGAGEFAAGKGRHGR